MGGSQGAITLNRNVPNAFALARSRLTIPLQVVHQSGRNSLDDVQQAYARAGVVEGVDVVPFIDDVPSAISRADLVIQRAGAGAVAEVAAIGRPSLLVPYPYAAGNHQVHNADALARTGAAVSVPSNEASAETLADHIVRLAMDADGRTRMANAARAHGRPEAAWAIAKDLLDLAEAD